MESIQQGVSEPRESEGIGHEDMRLALAYTI